jgi:hypothetical protein
MVNQNDQLNLTQLVETPHYRIIICTGRDSNPCILIWLMSDFMTPFDKKKVGDR